MDYQYLIDEFNTIICNSNHCFYCHEFAEERQIAMIIPRRKEDKEMLGKYDSFCVPLCLKCHHLKDELKTEELMARSLIAMETFEIEILNK